MYSSSGRFYYDYYYDVSFVWNSIRILYAECM